MSKTILKEIKEAIKAQRFKEAITKCEGLLKGDPKNPMIYILLGAAHQDSDKVQAATYLRKAVEYADGPPITALQGLSNCAPQAERPAIYGQLLDLVPDKYAFYYEKLYALADSSLLAQQCFDILKLDSQKHTESTERHKLCLKFMAKIWVESNAIAERDDEIVVLIPVLKSLFEEGETGPQHMKLSKRLLKLLYNHKHVPDCLKYACLIIEKYPLDDYAYEVICLIYCENYKILNRKVNANHCRSLKEVIKEPIGSYAIKLLEINPKSNLPRLIEAIQLSEQEQYVAARDALSGLDGLQGTTNELATYLSVDIAMRIGAYTMASKLWQSLEGKKANYAVCLSFSNQKEKLEEALKILETSKHHDVDIETESLARCYSKLDLMPQLRTLESKLNFDVKAEFLLPINDAIHELVKSVQSGNESYDCLILLGKLYLQQCKKAEALGALLKATRLRPYRAECFYNLGLIYQATNDLLRARKCFEKCVYLDPFCEEAVYNLSGIYQELKEEDLNVALLVNTLQHLNAEKGAERLHYKLGLHYLIANKCDDAIRSFRTALTFDVGRIIYWESLGDAYSTRGSYRSALRVFQKILEMDEKNVYAQFQIALLKTTLRMYDEAIEDFDNLLKDNPDYLPGRKGAAEAHIGLANNLRADHLYSRCKVHLQHAINHLQHAILDAHNHNMVWLWRLTATVLVLAALLPKSLANLEVSGKLVKKHDKHNVVIMRPELLRIAMRFYTCALKLKSNTFLWYELSLCCYYCGIHNSTEHQKMHLELAEKACKMAIQEKSDNWQNWNLLGVLYMHPTVQDLALAQHCFITALSFDRKLYTVWSNLGALYLILGEIKLANQAFKRAQQSNPIFGNAWIGQAMIAEAICVEDEALDLYRHCLQFEYHPESSLGYANGVSVKLRSIEKCDKTEYQMLFETMYADIVALDEINWYIENEEDNASVSALSIQGFLSVHQKLYRAAERAYQQAVEIAGHSEERNKMLENLGYVYLKMNEPQKAVDTFNRVTSTNIKSIIGLAMGYCNLGLHTEAYKVYENLVNTLDSENENKSGHILVAMAAILYLLQSEADTRTLLYQCILLENSPIEALYSACALSILHHDIQLTETILEEFKKYENVKEHCPNIAYLTSQAYLGLEKPYKALHYLQKRIHLYPHLPELRKVLADFLLKHCSYKKQLNFSTSQIALSAVILAHRDKTKKNICTDDANLLLLASRALKPINISAAMKLMQRALHMYPKEIQTWKELHSNRIKSSA